MRKVCLYKLKQAGEGDRQYLSLFLSLSDIGGEKTAGRGAGSRLADSSIRLSMKSLTWLSNWRIRSLFRYWARANDARIVIINSLYKCGIFSIYVAIRIFILNTRWDLEKRFGVKGEKFHSHSYTDFAFHFMTLLKGEECEKMIFSSVPGVLENPIETPTQTSATALDES